MIGNVRKGLITPGGRPSIVREGSAFALVEAGTGPGPFAGVFAADLAARKARDSGSCTVGVTRSASVHMLGYCADRIARQGQVGFVFSSSPPWAHPEGGTERVLGTNPLAVAVPTRLGFNLVLDMATTALAYVPVLRASEHGEPIPAGCAIDPDGNPTTDAARAIDGALGPLGGPKGFGLGLFVAILSGPLVGSDMGRALRGWDEEVAGPVGNKGHLVVAIDPGAFGGEDAFLDAVAAYVEDLTSSATAADAAAVRIPGERAYRRRAEALAVGSALIDGLVWQRTEELARSLDVEVPG